MQVEEKVSPDSPPPPPPPTTNDTGGGISCLLPLEPQIMRGGGGLYLPLKSPPPKQGSKANSKTNKNCVTFFFVCAHLCRAIGFT